MPKVKTGFYAVHVGRKPGIYSTWEECKKQVDKYSGANHKFFRTLQEAKNFVNGNHKTKPSRFYYAVRVGHEPGVYQTWEECEKQIEDYYGGKYKKFTTIQEAENFVKDGNNNKEVKLFLENSMQEISESSKQHSIPSIPVHSLASNVNNGELLVVWTDGSSLNNGQDNAMAGVGVYWGKDNPRNVSERLPGPKQTNNRAEIMAVIRALETCPDNNVTLEIRTDSKYTTDAVNSWMPKWKKNNWKKADNKDVKNLELFQRLTKLVKSRNGEVKFQHVPGHAGVVENEEADKLAKLGSMMDAVDDSYDYGEESDKKSKITDYFTNPEIRIL